MDKKQLKLTLEDMRIPTQFYSLDGELLPDRVVMDCIYGKWIVFYFDERGNREREKEFLTEEQACEHVLKTLMPKKKK